MRTKLNQMTGGLKYYCEERSKIEVEVEETPLADIEAYHNFIRYVPEGQMVENIQQIIDGYHKTSWSIFAFLPRLVQMEARLQQVHCHFPESQAKMTAILEALERKKKTCIMWTAVGYTAQTALAVATYGASTIVTAGGTVAYSFSAADVM